MTCIYCEGTGDGKKPGDGNCSICDGTGHVCDICGDPCEDGEYLCIECDD